MVSILAGVLTSLILRPLKFRSKRPRCSRSLSRIPELSEDLLDPLVAHGYLQSATRQYVFVHL